MRVTLYVIIFFLFYFEPLRVGHVSLAIVWKALLISVLVLSMLSRRDKRIHRLTAWGVLFVVASLLNQSLFIDPLETISFAVKNAYIPVIFGYWLQRVSRSNRSEELNRNVIIGVSSFILASTIPFLLDIISPMSDGYDLSIFGEGGGAFGFVGIFQNPHGASMTITAAAATLLWSLPYIRGRSKRLVSLSLLAVGLTASFLTLVRTGLLMFGASILMLLITSRKWLHVGLAIAVLLGAAAAGLYLFESSDTFRLRILGLNAMMVEQDVTLNQIGSGRLFFWATALERLFTSSLIEQLFGFGPTLAKDYMYEAIGLRIYAHNGFIDILQFYGYVGLLAYLMMVLQFFKILFALPRSSRYFTLLAINLTAYFMGMMVQGERYFLVDALLAFSLVGATVAGRHNKAEANVHRTANVKQAKI